MTRRFIPIGITDYAAEIAVGAQMREGPGFDADQHRMLEHVLDVAGDIGGDEHVALAGHISASTSCRVQRGGVHTTMGPAAR